ncbi:hypothetical protein Aperf_G00000064419 [Anoplocephala perfoliata]
MEPLPEEKRREYERLLIIAARRINPRMAECFLKCVEEEQKQVMVESETEIQSNFDAKACVRELARQFLIFVKEIDPNLSKFLEEGIRGYVLSNVCDGYPNTSDNNDFAKDPGQDFLNFLQETSPELAQYLALDVGEEISLDADKSESSPESDNLPTANSESQIISTKELNSDPTLKSIHLPKSLTKIRCCLLNVAFAVNPQIGRRLLKSLLSG